MGSPMQIGRVSYLWGTSSVNFIDLSIEEKVAFIGGVVGVLKEHFKYFGAFKPIKERFSQSWGSYVWARIEVPIEAPEGFDESTKCLVLFDIAHEVDGSTIEGRREQWVKEKKLLLTRNGRFVCWETNYERHIETGQGFDGDNTAHKYLATYCRFEWVNDDLLGLLLTENPKKARQLLDALQKAAKEAVEEREVRLQLIRGDVEKVNTAIGRLVLPLPF